MILKIIKKIIWSIKHKIEKFFSNIRAYFIIQPRYKKLIISIKNIFFNIKKIKVAFFITQIQLWCHQTIYDNFLSDNKFEPVIIVFPNEENTIDSKIKSLRDNYNFFKKNNMEVMAGYKEDLNRYICLDEINADIIFYDQPVPGLPKKLLFYEASKTSLICYVPYGFKVANFKQAHFNMELQNSSWKIFAESNWHKDQFVKYSIMKGRNVITSGYPKLDNYLIKPEKLILKKVYRKKIIWAPHWTVKHPIGYSTFEKNYKFFQEIAKKYSDIYWVFKPHQSLRHNLQKINFMTTADINKYYKFWDNLPNGQFFNESDYFNIFKNSDALITDCGSFLAEYLPTKKPILHLSNSHSMGFNDIGKKLLKTYYKALDNNDIIKFINNVVINQNDYLKRKRLLNLSLVKPNRNGAGKFIAGHILQKLKN